ncbi:MAG TPA: SPFH domain-containing protein [Candidatus Hydrogenedentes bacterium]|nr:SPFH domain-containing protein [Candidatus Hydrogenedentota bacterium]HPC17765.1 SPFH domain-containing protein [Candidatus Hydrogenedentota bacterium]HRT21576.1 SPFH domain-containing protein [Candidatus Hydrogenedentota bacterium]HRT66652.1 SPFH domain-containing protein [Candidatus Hydrogenedentota bacterium]
MKHAHALRLIAAAVLVACLAGCVPRSTGPTEVGVRTRKFPLMGPKGVENRVYPPGSTYFFVPFFNDWNTFDTRLNTLEMSGVNTKGDRRWGDDLLFKTVDGNDISLDIIVSWRIDPEKAPMILQEVATNMDELKENIIRAVTRSKPRDVFGELKTEDFYLAEKRSGKAHEVVKVLNEILSPYGVVVENVGTSDYRFNPDYQAAIEQRKVAEQRVEKARSTKMATEEEYRAKVEEAKGDVARMRAEADGAYKQAVIKADAQYKQMERQAEAILAEGRAEAEAIRKMNEALNGPGGEAVVKLAVAKALAGKRVALVPMAGGFDVRSTNINALLELYGIKAAAQQAPPASAQK